MARPLVVALAVVAAAGCSKKTDVPSTCGTHAPSVVAAATPTSVEPGGLVRLTATATDADDACLGAPEARSYRWRVESRPPTSSAVLSDPLAAAPTLTPDVPGDYQLEVVVTDGGGHESAPDFLTVSATTCSLLAPTVSFSGPLSGTLGNALSLPAPTVADANCLASGALSYRWTLEARPAGSSAVLSDPAAQRPVLLPDVVGVYQVSLVVSNSAGISSAAAFALVNVASCGSAAPALPALAASPSSPDAGDVVTLGLAGAITSGNVACGAAVEPYAYRWTLLSRPPGSSAVLTSETSPAPSFVPDVPGGEYQLALVVTDALGNASAPAFLQVRTSLCGALAPVLGGAVSFSGSPRANLSFAATAPAAADGNAACPARFATPVTSYAFSIVSRPAGAGVQLGQDGSAVASITATQGGTYGVQVVATSSAGLSSAPLVTTVAVSACGAYPPVATAFSLAQAVPTGAGGPVLLSDAPPTGAGPGGGGAASSAIGFYVATPVTVSASVADADVGLACAAYGAAPQPVTYAWSIAQAPVGSRASLGFASGQAVSLTPDVPGSYQLSLTTTDSAGDASTSAVTLLATCGASAPAIAFLSGSQPGLVTSQAAPVPLAVGAPISLGAITVDPDAAAGPACPVAEAQPLTYEWSFAQLPPGSQATLVGAATATPSFVPDVATDASGSPVPYGLSLTVTDPQGHRATARLDVTVTCDAAAPAVALVPGTTLPDFTATQQLPAILVSGLAATSPVTLARGAAFGADRAAVNGGPPVPTTARFYPGFPLQVAANVPSAQTSAGCGLYPQAVTYAWTLRAQPAGSAAALVGASGPAPSFVPDLPGAYELELLLTDQRGRSSRTVLALDSTAGHVVSVGSCGRSAPVPVARVATPIASPTLGVSSEPLGVPVLLDASASQSPDASPFLPDGSGGCGLVRALSYAWSLDSVPAGSSAALAHAELAGASVVLDLAGSYGVRLSVGDGTHVASTVLPVRGAEGFRSSPSATGRVFTATALDDTGHPVVAWWDNTAGAVGAARCTAGCDTSSPTWIPLGTVDSGLGTLTFAPLEEPRPVAVAVRGASTYVAYYTSTGPGFAGVHGLASCAVAIAVHDGTSWTSWSRVSTPLDASLPFTSCTAAGSAPFGGVEAGRWLSMTVLGGAPLVAYWAVTPAGDTELDYAACLDAACTASAPGTLDGLPGSKVGRWNALGVDGAGALHAVHYVDADGAGLRGLRWLTSASGSLVATTLEASASVDAGRFASLALVPANPVAGPPAAEALAIAYQDATVRRARLVRVIRSGGGWLPGAAAVVGEPAGVNAGAGVAVAADPTTGALRLAYQDATNGVVRIAASADGIAFFTVGQLPLATGASAPVGLSMVSGSGTTLAFSPSAAGPIGFYSGP